MNEVNLPLHKWWNLKKKTFHVYGTILLIHAKSMCLHWKLNIWKTHLQLTFVTWTGKKHLSISRRNKSKHEAWSRIVYDVLHTLFLSGQTS